MLFQIRDLPTVDHENGEMYGSPIPDDCKIPSELIEPYLKRFLMLALEEIRYFKTPISDIKKRLDGVRYFVGFVGGIHSRIAVTNEYRRFIDTPDDELRKIAKQIFK